MGWKHKDAFEAARRLTSIYGKPTVSDGPIVAWRDVAGYVEIMVRDESVPHSKPKPHRDFMYATVKFAIPDKKVRAVESISASISYDPLKKELRARCQMMAANIATLDLSTQVAKGQLSAAKAKKMYSKHIMALKADAGLAGIVEHQMFERIGGRKLKKSFIIGVPFRNVSIGGQVPSEEVIQAMKLANAEPVKFHPSMLLQQTGPVMNARSVVKNLGFDSARENAWTKFLQKALNLDHELTMRQDIFARMQEEQLEPAMRRVILQRALLYRQGRMKKSLINVTTPAELKKSISADAYRRLNSRARVHSFYLLSPEERASLQQELSKTLDVGTQVEHTSRYGKNSGSGERERYVLQKADAKGGTYHRRVTNDKGKHRYFYDPDKYSSYAGAHVSGEDAAGAAIRKGVEKHMEANPEGCPLNVLQPLVKRYGSKAVGKVLNQDVHEGKKFRYKDGKLFSKSERFVVGA